MLNFKGIIDAVLDFLKGFGAPQPQPIPVRVKENPRPRR